MSHTAFQILPLLILNTTSKINESKVRFLHIEAINVAIIVVFIIKV